MNRLQPVARLKKETKKTKTKTKTKKFENTAKR